MSDDLNSAGARPGEDVSLRLDRNWNELLQELRVAQTGVQILTGLLLTLPFSPGFARLDQTQQAVYLAVLSGSVLATMLLVSPVAFHRALFRHGQRAWLVRSANRCARAGLVALAATICGVVWLVFAVVAGTLVAAVAAAVCLALFVALWGLPPLLASRRAPL